MQPFMQKEMAIALHDYKAEGEGEMSFKRLDIIRVTKKNMKTGWFKGVNTTRNSEGWFPSTFVKIQ